MSGLVILYKSLSPVQLVETMASGWAAFSQDSPDQKVFAPKLHKEYAEMLARQLDAAAGYVVAFHVTQIFLEQFELQTIAYREHREYRIPVSALSQLNQAIVGKIELVSGFAGLGNQLETQQVAQRYIGYH